MAWLGYPLALVGVCYMLEHDAITGEETQLPPLILAAPSAMLPLWAGVTHGGLLDFSAVR